MMIRHKQNYTTDLPKAGDGDVFVECNFTRRVPGTKILSGVQRLSFIRCNLCRAVVPPDARIEDCNTSQDLPEAEPPAERAYQVDESMLKELVNNAEAGGMDVRDVRKKYEFKA